jgi:hypothetical protein
MRNKREYEICKAIAKYMKLKYPKIPFRFDMAGLNLSKAQAGMNKAIQFGAGWPDFFIAKSKGHCQSTEFYHGMYLEIKKEGTNLYKKNTIVEMATPHLNRQEEAMKKLSDAGYYAFFAIGLDDAINQIDNYLR